MAMIKQQFHRPDVAPQASPEVRPFQKKSVPAPASNPVAVLFLVPLTLVARLKALGFAAVVRVEVGPAELQETGLAVAEYDAAVIVLTTAPSEACGKLLRHLCAELVVVDERRIKAAGTRRDLIDLVAECRQRGNAE